MAENFKPGLYRHYKGGLYTAVAIVTHHETRQPMVLYVSHTYGGLNVRPLRGWAADRDGWADLIDPKTGHTTGEAGDVRRFEYIGELPSNTPITERKSP